MGQLFIILFTIALIAVIGHAFWLAGAAILRAIFGREGQTRDSTSDDLKPWIDERSVTQSYLLKLRNSAGSIRRRTGSSWTICPPHQRPLDLRRRSRP